MAIGIERFSELVGAIYDSAIDPTRWPVFFDLLSAEMQCQSGSLFVVEPAEKAVRFSMFWGVEISRLAAIETHFADDPTLTFLYGLGDASRDPDQPVVYRQVFDDAFLAKSPLFRALGDLYGFDDSIAILTLQRANRLGFLSVLRSRTGSRLGPGEVALMRSLAPHVRRAMTISDILEMKAVETAILGATLDTLADGVLLVEADMRIAHANRAARTMLERGLPIRLVNGRLAAADDDVTAELEVAVNAMAVRRLASPERPAGIRGVPLITAGPPAIAHVLPLTTGAIRLPSSAIAAVFVTRDEAPPSILGSIGAMYDMTPAEQRVAAGLARGASLQEVASALGISENTVKSHAGHIYAKTGVTRQGELVALLARLAPPLR